MGQPCFYYQQSSGAVYHPDMKTVLTCGYAGGNLGKNPEGKNNPLLQSVHMVGPLPRGLYTFQSVEDSPKVGPYAIPLIPDPSNEMFGREGFFIHGDDIHNPGCASEGCIVLPRFARVYLWQSDIHCVEVIQ